MDAHFAHSHGQRVLRQRNLLLLVIVGLVVLVGILLGLVATRDREVVLQPILSRPMTISSSGVTTEYLEAVTRDTAFLILNRSPSGLDYWMDNILKIVAPEAYGSIKAQLVKIVGEQSNTDIAQSFLPTAMTVDPKALTSQVTGDLRTFVGDQTISNERKTYVFAWKYSGVSLSLVRFGAVAPAQSQEKP
jgi:conjugal transfer pilus assembly protein TraE